MIFDDVEELEMLGFGSMFSHALGADPRSLAEVGRDVKLESVTWRPSKEQQRQYNLTWRLKQKAARPARERPPAKEKPPPKSRAELNRAYYLKNKARIAERRRVKWRESRAGAVPKKAGRPRK